MRLRECQGRRCGRHGTSLFELLLVACVLSLSLAPLFYVFKLSRPPERESELEFTATLLAHHVLERIIAQKHANPESLPSMTSEEPIVVTPEGYRVVSEYFRNFLGKDLGLEESDNPKLYWALKPFTCQVDTYYLDDFLYKVIVYISYEELGRKKRVFLERLLAHHPPQPILEIGK